MNHSRILDLAWRVLDLRPMRRSLSPLLLALGLVFCLVSVVSAAEVEERGSKVAKLEEQRAKLEKERRGAADAYHTRTIEIAKLKAQPSSWGRDRKLQKLLAESKDMASALERKDDQVRAVIAQVAAEKKALLAAIDRELAAQPGPDAARRTLLSQRRAELGQGAAKKIRLTDDTIDPLDDPEDLEYKAGALEQTEKRLLAEETRLEKRATYYRKQAKLSKARSRAEEQDVFRDEQPRGTGSRRDGAAADAQGSEPEVNGAPAENPPPPSGAFNDDTDTGPDPGATVTPPESGRTDVVPGADVSIDPAVVLADVVDSGTLDELRRAERSGDPDARAKAAERARKEVQARIEKIRQRRQEMERRAKKLRDE
jgi:hypothetical protein